MKRRAKRLILGLLSLFAGLGCRGVSAEYFAAYVRADRAAYDVRSPLVRAAVEADTTLTAVQKEDHLSLDYAVLRRIEAAESLLREMGP